MSFTRRTCNLKNCSKLILLTYLLFGFLILCRNIFKKISLTVDNSRVFPRGFLARNESLSIAPRIKSQDDNFEETNFGKEHNLLAEFRKKKLSQLSENQDENRDSQSTLQKSVNIEAKQGDPSKKNLQQPLVNFGQMQFDLGSNSISDGQLDKALNKFSKTNNHHQKNLFNNQNSIMGGLNVEYSMNDMNSIEHFNQKIKSRNFRNRNFDFEHERFDRAKNIQNIQNQSSEKAYQIPDDGRILAPDRLHEASRNQNQKNKEIKKDGSKEEDEEEEPSSLSYGDSHQEHHEKAYDWEPYDGIDRGYGN